jgi:hypothetical protein
VSNNPASPIHQRNCVVGEVMIRILSCTQYCGTGGKIPSIISTISIRLWLLKNIFPRNGYGMQQLPGVFSGTEFTIYVEKTTNMEANKNNTSTIKEPRDEFSMGATIAVSTLLLAFIGSSFYVLLTSYFELI